MRMFFPIPVVARPDAPKGVRPQRRLPVEFAHELQPQTVVITHHESVPLPRQPPGRKPPALKIGIHFPPPLAHHPRVRWFLRSLFGLLLATAMARSQQVIASPATASEATNSVSRLIEAAGRVECQRSLQTNWFPASAGLTLHLGDRVRTRAESRAAVQLSDRSIIRLSERTTLEILPPRQSERRRFSLLRGVLYFFNREKPADVEFDTPLAAGAIRGTEFLLEVAPTDAALHLALIDGQVTLSAATEEVTLHRGQDLRLQPGSPAQVTALLNANAAIQWALYYPGILNPDELECRTEEQRALVSVLARYRSGDLLAALNAWPPDLVETNADTRALHAQLELAVGRVTAAEQRLAALPPDNAAGMALRELISVVRQDELPRQSPAAPAAASASELLARTYTLQQQARLPAARNVAREAVKLAPHSGFARTRLAELELSLGNRSTALELLKEARALSPRLAAAAALQGFVLLDLGKPRDAQSCFDQAHELDAAYGPAWLGTGLCQLQERQFTAARAAFQAAAALEPQRGLFRSYLGKAASELGDAAAAEKEFNLAKQLDDQDPTAWLYSALHLWQQNRLNEALRDLERSVDLNDNRAVFRSRLMLDQDRSVRSANLAALYDEAGIPDASRHAAARAVSESYANFSGHLFLANSLAAQEDARQFDLRLETARQSELLIANLLAPPGAGNLSQVLSQQQHLRFFDQRPIGVSSLTEYASGGDWRQTGTIFGSLDGFSYAFDANYERLDHQQPNSQSERRQFALTFKQRLTLHDEAYFQIGHSAAESGDVANYYNPTNAIPGLRVNEKQEPTLYAGWHHEWSPGSHTLFLAARLDDQFTLRNPDQSVLFFRTDLFGGGIDAVQSSPLIPPVNLDFASDFTLYSAELQHLLEAPNASLILGGRWQSGDVDTHATLTRVFPATEDSVSSSFERGNLYAYGSWQLLRPLRLIGGVSFDHLEYPLNVDVPPLGSGSVSREKVSPKAGLLFEPWKRGLIRASYTKSLGGLYFDNSVRLEPSQVAGFNQAFRSLIPESVVGLVPGTEFETRAIGFDQSLPRGTWFGVELEQLSSTGERQVGAFSSFIELLAPETVTNSRESLRSRERNFSCYAGQLLGQNCSIGARYRLSEAKLNQLFPDLPAGITGLDQLQGENRATLQQLSLTANLHHRSGLFAQWESVWHHQNNAADSAALVDADFWQHNVVAGYRFAHRRAEFRLGVLNLFDRDYHLNPLNLHAELPRERTFITSLRLNF